MRLPSDQDGFDYQLVPSDWRFSAAIVGLSKYLCYCRDFFDAHYAITDNALYYCEGDIKEEWFTSFAESFYGDIFHHISAENMLKKDTFTEEDIKLINEKLSGNTIMKKVFKGIKFYGDNAEEILNTILQNRVEIVRETYRNKSDMYKDYCNPTCLAREEDKSCRIQGYNVDGNRKTKAISYQFNTDHLRNYDLREFDFIPFAFAGGYETFFINDNASVKQLIQQNCFFEEQVKQASRNEEGLVDGRKILFSAVKSSSDFIDYDVEVLFKNRNNAFFETLFIRKESIAILKKLEHFEAFCFSYKINENYYIKMQNEVINCILNQVLADHYIELFLKDPNQSYVVNQLIHLNLLLKDKKGGESMKASMASAYASAKQVVKKFEADHTTNKIKSYQQKLTSAIVFKDYPRVCEILLQLSNYSKITFHFAYDLYEDFEGNKELAYTFINALRVTDSKNDNKGDAAK